MSGLAPILARKEPPGVFRWEAGFDVEDLTSTLGVAGWSLAYLDGAYAQTKAEVLAGLGAALAFPDYYGANLDALADCLGDLVADTVLLWDDWGPFARADERSFTMLRRVLARRAGDDPERAGDDTHSAALLVLLRGEGHDLDLDVPLLD